MSSIPGNSCLAEATLVVMHLLPVLLSQALLWVWMRQNRDVYASTPGEMRLSLFRGAVQAQGSGRKVIVLARCGSKVGVPAVESVAHRLAVEVTYADCNLSTNDLDARETGIILKWIIRNFASLESGEVEKVIFHHAHQDSWHQRSLSRQLAKLFESKSYFNARSFGEVYPHFICHPLRNGQVYYGGADVLNVLDRGVKGTSFGPLNHSSRHGVWVSGQSSAFFVSSHLLAKEHSRSDYLLLLANIHQTVKALSAKFGLTKANYYVGECFERGWNVLFTNKTTCLMDVPVELGTRKICQFDKACRQLTTIHL